MAKGWGLVEQAVAAQEARKQEAGSFGNILRSKQIRESEGAMVVVRFLEQGNEGPHAINCYPRHEYKKPDMRASGGAFTDHFTCLRERDPNADCPGCNAGLKIVVRTALNAIQRQRPVLRRDAEGKAIKTPTGYIIDGYADDVVYWECASTTAEVVRRLDGKYGGLMSRDWELSWTGASFQPYALSPADVDGGPQPMSDADLALAAKRHDLDEIYKPPSFQEAAQIVARFGQNSGGSASMPTAVQQGGQSPPMGNEFLAGVNLPANPFGAAQK